MAAIRMPKTNKGWWIPARGRPRGLHGLAPLLGALHCAAAAHSVGAEPDDFIRTRYVFGYVDEYVFLGEAPED